MFEVVLLRRGSADGSLRVLGRTSHPRALRAVRRCLKDEIDEESGTVVELRALGSDRQDADQGPEGGDQ